MSIRYSKTTKTVLAGAVLAVFILGGLSLPSMYVSATEDSSERGAIPESIKQYELQEFNAVSFRNAIEEGNPISIQFKGDTYELEISPDSKVRDDVKAHLTIDGEKVEVPREDFGVYEGKVTDISQSRVWLVVNAESVHGIVKTPEVYFYIDPITKFDRNADSDMHILYDRTDEEFEVDLGNDVIERDASKQSTSDFWNITPTSDYIIPRAYAQTLLTFDIITHCDEDFYDIHPASWQSRSWLVIVDADAIMEDAIDITLDVVDQECDSDGSVFSSSTDCDVLINDLKDHWENDGTSRNGVQLVTPKTMDDNVLGCAWQLGISDPEDWAYSVVKAGHTSHLQGVLGAHELGHNMFGDHDDADQWWDWGCFCNKNTIMYPIVSSNTVDEYSSTNYDTIRTEAEAEL